MKRVENPVVAIAENRLWPTTKNRPLTNSPGYKCFVKMGGPQQYAVKLES